MNRMFKDDYEALYGIPWQLRGVIHLATSWTLQLLYLGRTHQMCKNKFIKKLYCILLKLHASKHGVELGDFSMIGKGIKFAHPYCITINAGVKIGENCTLMKGCTLGSIRGGYKAGVPVLGDRVVISLNATVLGNVSIGNDVLIAANAFVNFDVPDNSVVIGNPGVIHHKNQPTKMYS